MTTRIGITTDLETQRAVLERSYPNLSHWRIEAGPLTRVAAQQRKRYLMAWRGCAAQRDEAESGSAIWAIWYVYSFKHDVQQ